MRGEAENERKNACGNAHFIHYSTSVSFFFCFPLPPRLPVSNENGEEGGHDNKPEPQEDVSLLVYDVLREDAHGIVPADGSWRTEFVERAFGDTREHVDHRIETLLLVGIGERQNCKPKSTVN